MSTTTMTNARHRWRDHLASIHGGEDDGSGELVVGVAASFTAQPLEPYLGVALLESGVARPEIHFADFNQIHQVCLDPTGVFGFSPQRLVLLWRLEDAFERDLVDALSLASGAEKRLVHGIGELLDLVVQCAEHARIPIALGIPPTPVGLGLDPLDPTSSILAGRLHQCAVELVLDVVDRVDGIRLLDHRRLVEEVGSAAAHDARGMLLYRQPYRTAMVQMLGQGAAEVVASFDRVPAKVIVLDCDNTLWGGVVGEDGAASVAIGPSFPGNAFQQFQIGLERLAHRGVLLAVCSKNNPDDVAEVFHTRGEMVLGVSDIAAWRVNWNSKSDNIASIAAELNLGLDSFVVIDDSDYELAEVGAALPMVRALRVPDELAELPELLAQSGLFRSLRVTDEDRQRTLRIRHEQLRTSAQRAISPEDFLASLELRVKFFAVADDHVSRVTQLINKTNQFNLTTRRRTEVDVAELVSSGSHRVYAIEVDDRFGSYGLVGVAIVDASDASSWVIDTLLMSCRVLRRGVETALLSAVATRAREAAVRQLVGRYLPTAKNVQVESFYPEHGFQRLSDETFVRDLGDTLTAPGYIELVTDA